MASSMTASPDHGDASVRFLDADHYGESQAAGKSKPKPDNSAATKAKWQLIIAMIFCFVFMILGGLMALRCDIRAAVGTHGCLAPRR